MRQSFVEFLSDPINKKPLKLAKVFKRQGDHIVAGLLTSEDSWYPIINGVPRILVGDLKTNLLQQRHSFLKTYRHQLPEKVQAQWQGVIDEIENFDTFVAHQRKTAESFAFEWKYIYRENDFERENFFHFTGPYLTEEFIRNKATVDIGCGSGRFTKWAALSGTRVSFGVDLGESVEVAYEMTKKIPNACIVQADVYNLPFMPKFDIAYSIGVLHHLPQPQDGFARLPLLLKKGGHALIWVYNRRHNARAIYVYEPVRSVIRHLPKPIVFALSYPPAIIAQLLNLLTVALHKAGLKNLGQRIPFSYYANFPFNMKLNDTFDILATPKSNYYFREQIEKWFTDAKLKKIKAYEHPEAGITAIGTK